MRSPTVYRILNYPLDIPSNTKSENSDWNLLDTESMLVGVIMIYIYLLDHILY